MNELRIRYTITLDKLVFSFGYGWTIDAANEEGICYTITPIKCCSLILTLLLNVLYYQITSNFRVYHSNRRFPLSVIILLISISFD
jgi:hypothetical protein